MVETQHNNPASNNTNNTNNLLLQNQEIISSSTCGPYATSALENQTSKVTTPSCLINAQTGGAGLTMKGGFLFKNKNTNKLKGNNNKSNTDYFVQIDKDVIITENSNFLPKIKNKQII